jgi:phosphate transport system substrate-binding protein
MRAVAVAALVLASCAPAVAQDRVVIGGAGVPVPSMQALGEAYQAKHRDRHVEITAKPLGSTGGIRAVRAGALTIGLTVRPLHDDERDGLSYRPYARTPLVIGAHAAVPVAGLTDAQFCDIFAGRITSWKDVGGPDAPIVVLTRNDDGTKETFRAQVPCFKTLKETPNAIVMTTPTAMTEALSLRRETIGLSDLAALIDGKRRFKALAFNGAAPTIEALQRGDYPLYKTFGVVTAGEPSGAVRHFLDFVTSVDGERVMSRHGLVPVR